MQLITKPIPKIISFTGPMGSGKSTAAAIAKTQLSGLKREIVKFADPLYRIQEEVYLIAGLGIPKEKDRKLLQFIGTDWGRSKNPDIWLNKFKAKALYNSDTLILNDDARFDNEAELIKGLGGVVVKVVGPQRIEIEGGDHSSEMGISDDLISYTLRNDGDEELLKHNVRLLLDLLGFPRKLE